MTYQQLCWLISRPWCFVFIPQNLTQKAMIVCRDVHWEFTCFCNKSMFDLMHIYYYHLFVSEEEVIEFCVSFLSPFISDKDNLLYLYSSDWLPL